MQQLNSLILAQRRGAHLNSYSVELEHRLPGLLALYKANIDDPLADRFRYQSLATEFIGRGGQIHYVIDGEDRILGSAYMLVSRSPLQNLYPVERFFVETDIDAETRLAVADALIASIVRVTEEEVTSYPGSVWIQFLFPEGSIEHPESQPVYGALDANGFHGLSIGQAELWVRRIQPTAASALSEAA